MTMTTDIELDDLAEKRRLVQTHKQPEDAEEESSHSASDDSESRDGSLAAWAYASAGLLTLSASTLLLFPQFLSFLSVSSSEFSERTSTPPLERFLAFHFSFFLFAISICLVLYIPSDEVFDTHTTLAPRRDALGHPLLGPLTGACLLSSFISYNTKSVGSLSFGVFILTGIIGLWGLWVILFEGPPRISKKTGADKHTSSFLFGRTRQHILRGRKS